MKKKGAELLSIFLIAMLVFCSFSVSVFADQREYVDYGDSYMNQSGMENKQLYFLPLLPATNFRNYVIFYYPGDDSYYVFFTMERSADFYAGNKFVTTQPFRYYRYRANDWELVADSVGSDYSYWNYSFPNSVILDSTCYVDGWSIGGPAGLFNYTNFNGYRLYWGLALILINILNYVDFYADLIMQHVLIRYICLTALGGELLTFCVMILRRVGDIRNEEVNM